MGTNGSGTDESRKDTGAQPDKIGSQPDAEANSGRGFKRRKRGTTQTNNATKFEGKTEGLKGFVFDTHGIDQAEKFNTTIKEITEYVERQTDEFSSYAARILREEVLPTPKLPKKPATTGDADVDETLVAIWREEIKEHVKVKRRIDKANENLYGLLWGQTSERIRTKVKGASGYDEMRSDRDSIKLISVLRQVAYNVRHKGCFPATRCYAMRRLHSLRQERGMSLQVYYEKFKSIMEMLESLQIDPGTDKGIANFAREHLMKTTGKAETQIQTDEIWSTASEAYFAVIFILGTSKDHYWRVHEEFHNDYLEDRDQYHKTVHEAFALLSERKHDNTRWGATQSTGTSSAVAFVEVGDGEGKRTGRSEGRSQTGLVCWECGSTNHRRKDCPKYLARIEKESASEQTEGACGFHGGEEKAEPDHLESIIASEAANMLINGDIGFEDPSARVDFTFVNNGVNGDAESQEWSQASTKLNKQVEECSAAGLIKPGWILLDNQSTVNIFVTADYCVISGKSRDPSKCIAMPG